MKEQWKMIKISGFENLYEISNNGKVRYIITKKIRHNNIDKDGYYYMCLYNHGKYKTVRVSRLVAQAFIPNPNNLPQVNHINGIKTDNRMENLEWCSAQQNTLHAIANGLRPINYPHSPRKVDQIQNGKIIATYSSVKKAAQTFNVSSSAICDSCKHGWKTKGYNWQYSKTEIRL